MEDERELYRLLTEIDKKVTRLEVLLERVSKDYVTQAEFEPVKKLVYGVTGLLLSAVVVAVVALVVR
jgi:hypothetical protein